MIELGDRNEDLAYEVYKQDTIRDILNLFPTRLHLKLTKIEGKRREKLVAIKEMIRSFRSDAQILDKERKGDGGGRHSGGDGSKGLGTVGKSEKSRKPNV